MNAIKGQAALYLAAAATSLGLGLYPLLAGPCESCPSDGLFALLPWAGLLFYAGLAVLTWHRPKSRILPVAVCAYTLGHAGLTAIAVALDRICPGCIAIMFLALAAGGVQAWREPTRRWTLAAGMTLALLVGFGAVHQVNQVVLRDYYRVQILDHPPDFVDAAELSGCEDSNPVRLIAYQSTTPCSKCPNLEKEILSHVSKDFPAEVCIHYHVIDPPPGEPLPLLVLISATEQVVLTGRFRYEELEEHLAPFVARSPSGTR